MGNVLVVPLLQLVSDMTSSGRILTNEGAEKMLNKAITVCSTILPQHFARKNQQNQKTPVTMVATVKATITTSFTIP
jgi:hypothetical protein